jgi:vitamin B12 transporter
MRKILYALPFLARAPVASAQEPSTTFYSTATVVERPLSSATGSITVLDRDAIEATGARTMADVMRFLPGLDVTTNGARGGLTTAQIRGGDPNFTLVLLDGVPLNDPTYQVGDVYNLEGLPASAVERVEVVRGPLSSFYGSTGLAGAVNIVTRQGQDGPPAVEAQAMAGDASFRQGQGSVSGALGKATYYLGGTWEEEEHRVADERFRQSNVHANVAIPLGPARLQLKTRWADWKGDDYPDASGGPVYGTGELRRSDHAETSLASELAFGAQKLTLALYRHDRDTDSPAVFPQVPPSLETTRYTVARAGWASTLHDAGGVRLSAGVDVQREKGENDSVLLLPPEFGGEVRGDYEITRTLPGAFAELVVDRGAFVFEASSRFDLPEDGARQWSPRLGVSFRPGDGPTRFHASAGRAWKQPSFFALASPPQLGGNPDLRPEKVLGGDLGVDHQFAAASLDAGLTVFYNRYEDLIDFDFETFSHLNRSEVEAQGVEATLGWTPVESLSLSANATWQQVEDLTTQARLRHRPRWVGGLRIDWRPWDRLSLQLDTQATARSFDEQIPVPERDTVPGYALAGLAGTWHLRGPWEIRGRIDNVTDREYETLIGFPGPGRSVRVGLRYGGR